MNRVLHVIAAFSLATLGAACSPPAKTAPTPEPKKEPPEKHPAPPSPPAAPETPVVKAGMKQLFPHVRADLAARVIEIDGTVPIDCHDPNTPVVYLEVTVCTSDTKEHESLIVTGARPSHVHAALLAIGCQPGSPGSWKWEQQKLTAIPPTGDALEVTFAYQRADGTRVEVPATQWIRNASPTGETFGAGSHFVFAGSALVRRQGREVYDADGSGLLVGLTTFGSEAIAWGKVISHEAEIETPEWIADSRVVPRFGTPVIVRIQPVR